MTELSYQNIRISNDILYLLLVSASLVQRKGRLYTTQVSLYIFPPIFTSPYWLQMDLEILAMEASDNLGQFILFMNSV